MQIVANGLRIEVDDQGPVAGPPLLLIMGLGMQLTAWPQALVDRLVGAGFRVLRMDNRDAGLSQGFEPAGAPNLAWAGLRYGLRLPMRPPYTLADMADDAAGVLDALGLQQAHVVGASMGGMIGQQLAARLPGRVRSLSLMMTTTGARHLPQPGLQVRAALLSRPAGRDDSAIVAHLQRVLGVIGSPGYPPDPLQLRQRLQATVARAWRPEGTARQLTAVMADGDRSRLVAGLRLPVAVIHGCEDPLIPLAAGRQLAALVPGAVTDFIPGMGHDLPDALLPRFAEVIVRNARRADRAV